jgi:putative exosortase-associated protein (TIGR04073 family)
MKKHALPLLLASFLLAFSSMSFAEEQQSYGSKVGNKALNGFANMTTGILEIPKNIINVSNESNVIWGFLGGGAMGVLNTVGRLATGLTDLITAPLPTQPIVHPAYVWNDFDVDTSYGEVFRLEGEEPGQSDLKRAGNRSTMRY